MNRKLFYLVACGVGMTLSSAAAIRVWQGGGADNKWSTPANWVGGEAPAENDELVFEPTAGEIVTENDRADFAVNTLRFSSGYKVTVNGQRIRIGGKSIMWSNECEVVCNADLRLTSSDKLHCWGTQTTFNGDIAIDDGCAPKMGDGKNLTIGGTRQKPPVYFYGRISGTNATWNTQRCAGGTRPVDYYYGPVDVATFAMPGGTSGGYVYFYNAANACTNLFGAYDVFYFMKPNQFPSRTVVTLQNTGYGGQTVNVATDQTFGRIVTTYTEQEVSKESRYSHVTSSEGGTLTLLGESDSDVCFYFSDDVNFIWAPTGAHTFTLARATGTSGALKSANTTTGSLTVSNGTFKVVDGVRFTQLARMVLFNTGCFEVASDAANPFGTSGVATLLDLHGSSTVALAADLTVGTCQVDGVPLAAGDYTATDLPGRLTGVGTLHVLSIDATATYWQGTDGGVWNLAANWNAGLPSLDMPALVRKDGDRTVNFDLARYDGGLTVGARVGCPKVKLSQDALLTGAVDLGDESGETRGALEVAAGDVVYSNRTSNVRLTVRRGGTLAVTGGSFTFDAKPLEMAGGFVDVSGSATLRSKSAGYSQYVRTGKVRVRDNATYQVCAGKGRAGYTPCAAGETCTVEVSDNAVLNCDCDSSWLNTSVDASGIAGSSTKVSLSGHAKASFGNALYIASGDGTTGELSIADHAYAVSDSYQTHVGGCKATSAESPAYGVLRISGGAYLQKTGNATSDSRGFGIGTGFSTDSGEAANLGHVYLSGGSITNSTKSRFVIGGGAGRGFIHQTGGVIRSKTDSQLYPTIIGFRGGEGLWEMSGDTSRYTGNYDVYVGGCPTSVLDRCFTSLPTARPGFGTLKVSGGTFATETDLWVSREGRGTIEIGAAGTVSAKNLYLTNSVDGVDGTTHYAATLRFTLGAEGCGTVTCSGNFEAAPDAKLIIDTTACVADSCRIDLITAKNVTMPFKGENITFIPSADGWAMRATATGYSVAKVAGMLVIFR